MSGAAEHMDRIYRWQAPIYDLTRKPYLLGRDQLIASLAPPPGGTVLEIGCGTGRNLVAAARHWPRARFYGFDISTVMLANARRAVQDAGLEKRITLAAADAATFEPQQVFGRGSFDRVFMSYTLSMIPPWREALARGCDALTPEGELFVADFGDQAGLPKTFRAVLYRWLAAFSVTPRLDLDEELDRQALARGRAASVERPYRGYAVLGHIGPVA
ncbi:MULTISPECIES: class I SAM-dependent methyltransferase [unclassified Beijerinckia]|uniref:class I SAM-dependent methyltransferase n=1 Tax=unclassified Beijerinckia TaxID=2638183 RepID=UPI00089AABCD|nr:MULTISPECIES: class I SAM-dependent methyltransferase [unclassified Beijerinckia]MDH7794676.1 S-adenosylmethionine-diacylgycerolhomoserine-N-methyltransferase [Beijerinckia sp. GAS462]SEB70845.1 S-adenosylmethionine-diacylgycerolhomoserine-N-methlytransferase [Beijerinckia sp. 28-YEA-48]